MNETHTAVDTSRFVFCIGAHKTGTTSLTRAFDELGYNVMPEDESYQFIYKPTKTLLNYIESSSYNFFEDSPFNLGDNFQPIHKRFPDARFILTYREEESWFDSVMRWTKANDFSATWELEYGCRIRQKNKKKIVRAYSERNRRIERHFSKNINFIRMDICAGDGWEELGEFLGIEALEGSFYHENSNPPV